MKTLALITKRRVLEVVNHNDGTINILKADGAQIAKLDAYIADMGGVDAVLSKTVKFDGSFADFIEKHTAEKIAQHHADKAVRAAKTAEHNQLHAERWAALQTMTVIPVNEENLKTVMRELNSQNWGSWSLPKLSIGYKAAQYDCNGVTATTITFDRPVKLNEYREPSAKFEYNAPRGHLTQYQSI